MGVQISLARSCVFVCRTRAVEWHACARGDCDVDVVFCDGDGEPMPHIRYAHSELRGCDVTSGLHALRTLSLLYSIHVEAVLLEALHAQNPTATQIMHLYYHPIPLAFQSTETLFFFKVAHLW